MPRDKRAWLFKRNERPGWWVGWYHNGKLRKKKSTLNPMPEDTPENSKAN